MIALGRRVRKASSTAARGAGHIVSPDVENRIRVRRRLDRRHIHFPELLNMVQHVAELLREFALFFRRQREAREKGNVVDVEFSGWDMAGAAAAEVYLSVESPAYR